MHFDWESIAINWRFLPMNDCKRRIQTRRSRDIVIADNHQPGIIEPLRGLMVRVCLIQRQDRPDVSGRNNHNLARAVRIGHLLFLYLKKIKLTDSFWHPRIRERPTLLIGSILYLYIFFLNTKCYSGILSIVIWFRINDNFCS